MHTDPESQTQGVIDSTQTVGTGRGTKDVGRGTWDGRHPDVRRSAPDQDEGLKILAVAGVLVLGIVVVMVSMWGDEGDECDEEMCP